MDESTVADEDAHVVDPRAPRMEEHQVSRHEIAAVHRPADGGHLDRGAGKRQVEHPLVHELHEPRTVEPLGRLPAPEIPNAEELPDVFEKAAHGIGRTLLLLFLFRSAGRDRSEGN